MMKTSSIAWVGMVCLGCCGGIPAQINPLTTSSPELLLTSAVNGRPEAACDTALNRSGDGIFCWRRRIATTPVNTYEIRAQELRRGEPHGPAILLATTQDQITGTLELTVVRCAIDDFGNWVVVWDASDMATGTLQVFGRRYHAASAQLGPVLWLSDTTGLTQHDILPDVALGAYPQDLNPNFYVVWQEGTQAGQSLIRLRRYRMIDVQGSITDTPDAPIQANSLNNGPNDAQDRPAIAIDSVGHLTLVWERYQDWTGTNNFEWRTMIRRRLGNSWTGVFDPASPVGVQFTDFQVSNVLTTPAPSDARFPPRVTTSPDGKVAVAWRRVPSNYAVRYFAQGLAPAISATPPGDFVPASAASGTQRFDIALCDDGSLAFLYMSQASPFGNAGRPILARLRFGAFVAFEELLLQPGPNILLSELSLAASNTGQVFSTWTTGTTPSTQRLKGRSANLNFLDLLPGAAPPSVLHLSVLGQPGRLYHVWPASMPGTYAQLPLGDGRALDIDFLDPLVQAFLAQGGNNPHLPNAIGFLDTLGTANVPVILPPGLGPVPLAWTLLVSDPTRPFPASIVLFTQPEVISVQ